MAHISKNILHDWKTARMERSYLSQVEFLGSTMRVSFLRAWAVTAMKVLFVFAFMNFHVDVASKLEENVLLLDRYINNDFQIEAPVLANTPRRQMIPKVITANIEPRGPLAVESVPQAAVAGDSTTISEEIIEN